ncbi:hypothetical protein JL721_9407 [Aureococcus anophagefferens]|nr:hypothetical protein JL721_9407 [Aureococcus anophagefferens]
MASAGVKEIRRLQEEQQSLAGSQSVPSLGAAADDDGGATQQAPATADRSNSIARKLYTESERDLLTNYEPSDVVADAEAALDQPTTRTPRPYEGLPAVAGMAGVEDAVRAAAGAADIEETQIVDGETGDTALLLCAQYGAGDLVELLVAQGAEVNARLPNGATALHYMSNGATLSPPAVVALLRFGADPNVAELHTGATPLMYAADAGATAVCEDLVRHGADAAAVDFDGYDALGYAAESGLHACVAFLKSVAPKTKPKPPPPTTPNTAAAGNAATSPYSIDIGAPVVGAPSSKKKKKPDPPPAAPPSAAGTPNSRRDDFDRELAELRDARETLKHLAGLADKASGELRSLQYEAATDRERSASLAAGAQARADELERARSRAAAAGEAALEQACAPRATSGAADLTRRSATPRGRPPRPWARPRPRTRPRARARPRRSRRDAVESQLLARVAAWETACGEAKAALEKKIEAHRTDEARRQADLDGARRDASSWEAKCAREAERRWRDAEALRAREAEASRRADAERDALRRKLESAEDAGKQREAEAARRGRARGGGGAVRGAEQRGGALEQQLLSLAATAGADERRSALEEAHRAKMAVAEAAVAAARGSGREAELRGAVERSSPPRSATATAGAPRRSARASRTPGASTRPSPRRARRWSSPTRSRPSSRPSSATRKRDEAAAGRRRDEDAARARRRGRGGRAPRRRRGARSSAASSWRCGGRRGRPGALRGAAKAAADADAARQRAAANLNEVREQALKFKADLLQKELEAAGAARELQLVRDAKAESDASRGGELAAARERLAKAEADLAEQTKTARERGDDARRQLKKLEDDHERQKARDDIDRRADESARRKEHEDEVTKLSRALHAAQAEAAQHKSLAASSASGSSTAAERAAAAEACGDALRCSAERAASRLAGTTESYEGRLAAAMDELSLTRASLEDASDGVEKLRALEQRNARLDQDLTRESMMRRKLHNQIEDMKGKIRVLCRVRPLAQFERDRGAGESAVVKDGEGSLTVLPAKEKGEKKKFMFDFVFDGAGAENSQPRLFEDVKQLITSTVDGYNVCLFCYGQTGSGKTFTMGSDSRIGATLGPDGRVLEGAGIAPRSAEAVFDILEGRTSQCDCTVTLSMFEVYCDKLVDLLNTSPQQPHLKITLAEHSPTGLVHVEGAKSREVADAKALVDALAFGIGNRTVHATKMNSESSRSHLVMMMEISSTNKRTGHKVTGKLTLVDLAGSERVDKSGATGGGQAAARAARVIQRRFNATAINKSLSALGDVIASLTAAAGGHVPYRNHPLTMLMSDSVGGSAKTMMIVCSSPASDKVAETLSSLQFATRCKDVRSSADPRAAAATIADLKAG